MSRLKIAETEHTRVERAHGFIGPGYLIVSPEGGAAMVDWIWKNHASLGHSMSDLESFAASAREAWVD